MLITLPNQWSPRAYQTPAWEFLRNGGRRAAICWPRRHGKDDVSLHFTAIAAHERVGSYWHMLPEKEQARKAIWTQVNPHTGMKRIDEAFPIPLRKRTNDQEMFIEFQNNSTWQIAGSDNYNSLVGSSPCGIVFSEYALSNPAAWAYLRPILRENKGWAIFISTPRGRNHFYQMIELAKVEPDWFGEVLTCDDTKLFSSEELQADLRELQAEHGESYGKSIWLQENFCVPPETRIWTEHGQRPIRDLVIGDKVLTHAGRWRPVTRIFRHETTEPLLAIRSAGSCEPLRCTPDHPIRVCTPSTQRYEWRPAKDVRVGEYVVLPRIKIPKCSAISKEFAELIAWFIAEGSVAKTLVQFTLNATEMDYHERIMACASPYGKPYTIQNPSTHATVVVIHSCWLADFLTTQCGSGSANKHIPWTLIAGHEDIVYRTLIDGDGCRGDYKGVDEVFTTVSYSLALDVQMLAMMLGKRATITKRPKEKQTQMIQGRSVTVQDSYSVRIATIRETANGRPKLRPQKHGIAALVTSIEELPTCHEVMNVSVQYEESYVAEGRVVHNCSFDAAIPGAIWAESLDRVQLAGAITDFDLSPSQPVFTGWDLGRTDDTAIWFYQFRGQEIDVLDFWSGSGCEIYDSDAPDKSLTHILLDKARKHGYKYGTHWVPHDARPRRLGMGGKSILQQFHDAAKLHPDLGKFAVAPKLDVQEGIQAARKTFQLCRFHKTKCDIGLQLLRHYHREWDADKKMYLDTPVHDFSSHCADAMRTMALTWKASKIEAPPEPTTHPIPVTPLRWGQLRQAHFDKMQALREGYL